MTEAEYLPRNSPLKLLAGPRQTFWAIVGRAYWRSRLNRIMSAWVLVIALLTVFAPFLANSAPFTVVIDRQREYPLLRNLTRIDLIWLVWGAATAGFAWVFLRTGRLDIELEQLRARRLKWALILGGIAVVASGAIALLKADYLDSRDYHAMYKAGELKSPVFAPLRWSFQDQEPLVANRLNEAPTADHWLGTDSVGRDVLSRLLWGARIVLELGFVSEVIALVVGAIYGALMGYYVGKIDMLGMRFVEILEAVPLLFLLITVVALFGRQLFVIMLILGLTGWTGIARFVRAEFFRIRKLDYVVAAEGLGLPVSSILFKHMLPNGLTPVIVTFTFGVAGNIVSESILSFLGIGVEPPTASWGSMLDGAVDPDQAFRWWLALAPGIMIFLTVFAYNVIGEGLRDAIDPRTNKVQ